MRLVNVGGDVTGIDLAKCAEALLMGAALAETYAAAPTAVLSATSCTRLMMAGMEGLIEAGPKASPVDQGHMMGHRCRQWCRASSTASSVCAVPCAMAAVGCLYPQDGQRIRLVAEAFAQEMRCVGTAAAAWAATAAMIGMAIQTCPVSEYPRRIMELVDGMNDMFDAAIYRVGHVGAWTDVRGALEHIGLSGQPEEVVAHALYWLLRSPDDYAACIRDAATMSADMLGCVCTVGAVMGVRLGTTALPDKGTLDAILIMECGDVGQRLAAAKGVSHDV